MGSPQHPHRASLVEGDIARSIIRLTIPMVFGMIGLSIFNIVDTLYVGRLGVGPLAALSFTFPVVLVLNNIALGIGVGTSSVVSRALGSGDHHRTIRYTTDSLTLGLLVIIIFATIGELTIRPLFSALGARGEILDMIVEYMTIWYAGLPFVVFPMIGNSAIRALGDTKTPGMIMLIASLVNVILDPLMIFGIGPFPMWGIRGAAIATVISRSLTFTVAIYVLSRREHLLSFKQVTMRKMVSSWREILSVGAPAALTRVIVPISAGVVTGILASLGTEAVAGYGVATKVERFALLFTMALATVMAPFAGQNFGAGRLDRVRSSLTFSVKVSLGVGVILALGLWGVARPLASLFSHDPAVIAVSVQYFRIVPLSYGLLGMFTISTMVLNALNQPLPAAGFTLLQMFGLLIPFAWVGSSLVGTVGVFAGVAAANLISGALTLGYVRRKVRQAAERAHAGIE